MTAPPRFARPSQRPFERHDFDQQPTETLPVPKDEQRFSLSATQITASMAAAATAALVGSKLGVAGTVIGAGLASVISVVGGAIFGHSILLTRKQVRRAVLQVRRTQDTAADRKPGVDPERADHLQPEDDRTVVIPVATGFDLSGPYHDLSGPYHDLSRPDHELSGAARRPAAPERTEPRRPRPTRRKLGAGLLVGIAAAAAIFAGSLAAVTLVETVKGSPLSGGESGGLSVLGGNTGNDSGTSVEVPVTSTQVTAVSTVTQTVTSEPTESGSGGESAPSSQQPASTTAATSASSTPASADSSAPSSSAPAVSSTGGISGPADASRSAAATTSMGTPSDGTVLGR